MARASRPSHPRSPLPYFRLTNPADPEAEYQLEHYVPVDISLFVSAIEAISGGSEYQPVHDARVDIPGRELSAPAGAQYPYAGREMVLSTSGITGVSSCRSDWRTRLPTARYVRPIVLEYVGRTRRSMPSVRRNGRESGPAPSASLRDTTRQSQPSRPSGSRKIAWPPTRKQNINRGKMPRLIFPVVSFPLRPVRVIRRPFPVFPCPIADCRLSAFARRTAAWNVLHPTWRGREGVLWRMGKAGTVWRRASRCAVS